MKNIKFLSFILALVFVFSVFPFNTVYAVENTENAANTQETQEFTLPDIVDTTEARERGYVGRVKDEEKDNYTFVFQNSDNTRTMRVYSHPVKYTDKDGNTKDITLDIQSRTGGGFETKDNSIKTTFGKKLSDGIRLQHEEVDVKLIPANLQSLATLSADSKTVSYVLDEKTTLEYSLTYTGFKEDIVVSEYTGQTEYTFLLYTNGLTVKEEMGSHYLADSEGNRKANIGDIIIFTADERNNTLGELTYTEVKSNQIYLLTIHIDAEYLADEDTVYPIRIDPTLEVNGTGAIEDVTVYTGSSYYSGTSGILYVGTDDGKVYRALMRFPELDLPVAIAAMVRSAAVEMRDVMCQSTQVPIECRYFSETANAWTESTTTTWNTIGSTCVGGLLDTKLVYYGNGNEGSDSQRYAFDITEAVKNWVNGYEDPACGLIFKTSEAFESEAATSSIDRLKYFGSYNRSDYKPSLTIKYDLLTAVTISQDINGVECYLTASETDPEMCSRSFLYYDRQFDKTGFEYVNFDIELFWLTLWCIEYDPINDAHHIIPMGYRDGIGTYEYGLYCMPHGVGLSTLYGTAQHNRFEISPHSSVPDEIKYNIKNLYTNSYLSTNVAGNSEAYDVSTSSTLGQYEYFNINVIETETFNNFFNGTYTTGIYNGVAHIKVLLDSSITSSERFGSIDFSVVTLWNGITENVIIYGPNDEVPAGITPFYVTYIAAELEEDVLGITLPDICYAEYRGNGYAFTDYSITGEDWSSVTIVLNDRTDNNPFDIYDIYDYHEDEMEQEISSTICHEMGHALKLAHPFGLHTSQNMHSFPGMREDYNLMYTVASVMEYGGLYNEYSLNTIAPTVHDKINLVSKWEYHANCNH